MQALGSDQGFLYFPHARGSFSRLRSLWNSSQKCVSQAQNKINRTTKEANNTEKQLSKYLRKQICERVVCVSVLMNE